MRVQYLDLADFLAVACEVTGLDLDTVTAVANLGRRLGVARPDGRWLLSPT